MNFTLKQNSLFVELRNKKLLVFLSSLCLVSAFSLANAQSENSEPPNTSLENDSSSVKSDNDEDSAVQQETVIVSGTGIRRSVDLWVNPVNVLNRDEIIQRLHTSLGDTLANEPGVSTSFFGAGASRPIVRGLGAERVLVLSNGLGTIDASVTSPDHQVVVDGLYAQRIEVLRGPAALAYGGQAIGGGVNVLDNLIMREKPLEEWSGEAFTAFNSVSDGNDSGISFKGSQKDQPFIFSFIGSLRDHNDYSISGNSESKYLHEEEEDDDHEATGKAENTFISANSLAGGISWIGEQGYLGFGIRSYSTNYGLPGHGHHEEEEEEEEEEHESPFVDLEQTKLEIHGQWAFEQQIISNVSGSFNFANYEHTEFEAVGEPGTIFENEGLEANVKVYYDLDFALVTGLNYSAKTIAASGEEAFLSSTDSTLLGVFAHTASKNESNFGWEAGIRFENSEYKNITIGSKDFSLFSSSGGVTWENESGFLLGAQVSLTERSANESELFAKGPHLATRQYEVGDSNLSKERGLSIETSARWNMDRFGIGLNAYAYNFDNFIYLEPGRARNDNNELVDTIDELKVYRYVQDNAEFRGAEAFFIWDITQSGFYATAWQIRLDLDFVDAQFDDGSDVPLIPPTSANLRIKTQGERWRVEGNLKFVSEKDAIANRQPKTDGYNSLGLYGELELSALGNDFTEGARAFLDIRNITDEEIRYSTSVLKDHLPAPGTNIRAGVRWNF